MCVCAALPILTASVPSPLHLLSPLPPVLFDDRCVKAQPGVDVTLVYVQYLKHTRRTEGVKAAREVRQAARRKVVLRGERKEGGGCEEGVRRV